MSEADVSSMQADGVIVRAVWSLMSFLQLALGHWSLRLIIAAYIGSSQSGLHHCNIAGWVGALQSELWSLKICSLGWVNASLQYWLDHCSITSRLNVCSTASMVDHCIIAVWVGSMQHCSLGWLFAALHCSTAVYGGSLQHCSLDWVIVALLSRLDHCSIAA